MKVFVVLLLFGLAAATNLNERWERERDDTISQFVKEMKRAVPLRVALGMPDIHELDETEDEVKTQIVENLKDALNKVLLKIQDILDRSGEIKGKLLAKVGHLLRKLKDMNAEVGEDLKEMLEKIKEKVKEHLRNLIDRLIGNEKEAIRQTTELAENNLDLKEILRELKRKIAQHFDKENIKEFLEKVKDKLGKWKKVLLDELKENNGVQLIQDLIRKLIGDDSNRETRSLKEMWQKMKDFFKEKHIELKEKWANLADWLKKRVDDGRIVVTDKIETMKKIAKQFIEDSKNVSKEVASEVLEALRPYKEDFKDLYENVKEKVKEVLHKKD